MDDFSRRVLHGALRLSADEGHPVRLHAFAGAARELFRHVSQTLVPPSGGRCRRQSIGYPARDRPSDTVIAGTARRTDDLLAAIDHLHHTARLHHRVTVTNRATPDRFVSEGLSALQGLYDLFGGYLEQALQPFESHVSRQSVRAFVLETRAEVHALAACHTAGNLYAESLSITQPDDKSVSIEVEASLGAARP